MVAKSVDYVPQAREVIQVNSLQTLTCNMLLYDIVQEKIRHELCTGVRNGNRQRAEKIK